jgi:hypothetical protein
MMVTLTSKSLKAFINTPPLWLARQFGIEQFVLPEIDNAAVKDIKVAASMRLGHKMEHIFENCLKGQDRYKLIAHNTTVKRDNRTIGEIDFLLKDTRDRSTLHLELTYKFYLINPTLGETMHQLIGPNRRDTFYSKLEKLRNNQLQLPYEEEGIDQLALLDVKIEDIRQEVCFKAQLFTPYSHSEIAITPFNNQCVVGFWITLEAFTVASFQAYEYCISSKDDWILKPYDKGSWMSHNELLLELNILLFIKRSPLIWVKKKESVFEKFFVVWW